MARTTTKEARERVAREIVDALVEGLHNHDGTRWTKPWADTISDRPHNATTGKPYHGGNVWVLAMVASARGYAGGRWATYKQWQGVGVQVQRGERGTTGFFAKTVVKNRGTEDEERFPVLRTFTLFHADQTDAPPEPEPEPVDHDERERAAIAQAVEVYDRLGIPVQHQGNQAATIGKERVVLPPVDAFRSGIDYYATAMHEAGHWTGHPSRLDRPASDGFGNPGYAREELIVELASVLTAAHHGIVTGDEPDADHHRTESMRYMAHWLQSGPPDRIYDVLKESEKIADLLAPLPDGEQVAEPMTAPDAELEVAAA